MPIIFLGGWGGGIQCLNLGGINIETIMQSSHLHNKKFRCALHRYTQFRSHQNRREIVNAAITNLNK